MTKGIAMDIKAVKFRKDGFYSQPFVFGGEEGQEKFDKNIRYRGSLQNYLIDTGNEVILVDTGLPAGFFPDGAPEETASIYIGKSICDYMDALVALGYKPEQVTKILLTHKHADHSGELRSFPNAKIYVNAEEIGADELKDIPNIVPVEFTDGAYYNFPESQKIADGVYFIKAQRTRACSICSRGTSPTLTRLFMRINFLLSSTTCQQLARRWTAYESSFATNLPYIAVPIRRRVMRIWRPSA